MRHSLPCNLLLIGFAALALTGCVDWQSALQAKGPHANHLAAMIWIFTGLLSVVWLAVMAALAFALFRHRREHFIEVRPVPFNSTIENRGLRLVTAFTIVTGLIVLTLTGISFTAQHDLFSAADADIRIKMTGHQWWWEAQYEDAAPSRVFTTANEIHIPVNTPVRIELESQDVIHSFWVPSLNGKKDLIPGQQNDIEIIAAKPGVYRGQCAEFCGLQHAHMSFLVIAEDRDSFEHWREAQTLSAAAPLTPEQKTGETIFMSNACVMCHEIDGTPAGGHVGPNLTHLGSRRMIAAGELPLTSGSLAAWIADPQNLKPGSQMPAVALTPHQLSAVVAYLEGLK